MTHSLADSGRGDERLEPFDDDELKLVAEILKRAKITMWAASGAEENYAIRLWSPGAQEVYGYSRDEALGSNYIDLFVNQIERARAIADHERMVANDEAYEWDWAADDIAVDGSVHTMLTNCFPVVDPRSGRALLAEIGVDLSQQEQASARHSEVLAEAFKEVKAGNVRFMGAVTSLYSGPRALDGAPGVDKTVRLAASVMRTVAGGNPTVRIFVQSGDEFLLADGSDPDSGGSLAFDEQHALELLTSADAPAAIFVDSSTDPDSLLLVRRARGRSRTAAVIPITFGFELRGMVAIHFRDRRRISEDKRSSLEHLGMHIGVVLAMEDQRIELERSRALEVKSIEVQAVQKFLRLLFHRVGNSAYVLGEDLRELGLTLQGVDLPKGARTRLDRIEDRRGEIESALEDFRKERDHVHEIRPVDIRSICLSKGQEIELTFPTVEVNIDIAERTLVRTSEYLIAETIGNLLRNAAEEVIDADGGGDIRLRATQVGSTVLLDVEDTGRGIPVDRHESIWARGESSKGGGHGYGLPFAREAVELANGRVLLQDQPSELGGAHFTLILQGD